jgi:phosphoglycolate phosphatase
MSATETEPHYVFDLDGTIIDGFDDLLAAVNHALSRAGAQPLDLATLTRFVGHGAIHLVEQACQAAGVPASQVGATFQIFSAAYRARCTVGTRPYPGVADLLKALGPSRACVLTNKPRYNTLQILRELHLRPHVGPVVGGDSLPVRKPNPSVLRFVAHLWGVPIDRLIMVGDSAVDFEVAHRAGIEAIGVAWNQRSVEDLKAWGADRVVRRPAELLG